MSNGGLGFGKKKLVDTIISQSWPGLKIDEKKFNYNELLYIIQEMSNEEGKKYLQGGQRSTGFSVFREFMKHLLYRNIANFDSMILLTATKGAGKSSAAIMMGREWMRLLGRRFNPKKHIAYSNQDLMKKIDAADKFDVIVADESYRFVSSADWAKKENKELKKKLAEIRTKHLLFILCFPMKVTKVESSYMDSFINIWCLNGDTKVWSKSEDGKIYQRTMKELSKMNNFEVLTYNTNTKKYEYKKTEGCIKTKTRTEVFEVELENGKKVKATEDHLFLTSNGYKKLKDLTTDDEIIINEKECELCKKKFFPKDVRDKYCSKQCWGDYEK